LRIVFFTHYYPPEVNAGLRVLRSIAQWAEAGHDVTVVTSVPNHPRGIVYPGYRNRLFQYEMIDGVKVVRVWTHLAPNEGILGCTFHARQP
jgi:hypothetical protein